MTSNITKHPAHIIVGDQTQARIAAINSLQELFCSHSGCRACSTCRQIRDQQFHAITWLSPAKGYTLDDLEPIFAITSFALTENQQHVFVIPQADLLSPACSNSLLKILEEPPQGYHFLLLTNRLNVLLPTIRSRCTLTTSDGVSQNSQDHEILNCFKSPGSISPTDFLKLIDTKTPHEIESVALVDHLIAYWMEESKKALRADNPVAFSQALDYATKLQKSLELPPMPGSSKIFWRNLYLQLITNRY